jgi:2-oxoglutarate ferredoxin oxidoreductase subunit beta
VTPGENGVREADILVHDETSRTLAAMLVDLKPPQFPVAIGVLYCDPMPSYDQEVQQQLAQEGAKPATEAEMDTVLRGGRTWEVK